MISTGAMPGNCRTLTPSQRSLTTQPIPLPLINFWLRQSVHWYILKLLGCRSTVMRGQIPIRLGVEQKPRPRRHHGGHCQVYL
jgi:hypothetical protein